jgi:hypothetical protein
LIAAALSRKAATLSLKNKCLLALLSMAVSVTAAAPKPLSLHSANPHYFLFRGKPTVLVTSGEHYGSVINRDFNYSRYLNELARNHLNLTRIWVGPYREVTGNFDITSNTLAPQPARFLPPWPRSSIRGAADGGNKFDLKQWKPAYFARLHDFVQQASKRGVVVEINLFCPYYEESMWQVSPLNATNNVNGIGSVPRTQVLTMQHPDLVAVEDAMVRKVVGELNSFDNIYYEICNEPYFGGVTLEWQRHISETIVAAEAHLPNRHLISQNIANGSKQVKNPDPRVSIFNFHYSRPPSSVGMNYKLDRVIGYNETGFDGQADAAYRIQGWDFLVAGGALYNNLDYSFAVGHEDGGFHYPPATPGGGSAALRKQLGILKQFFDSLDVTRMQPNDSIARLLGPDGGNVRVLAAPKNDYVVYVHHGRVDTDAKPKYVIDSVPRQRKVSVDLPIGSYEQVWLNTKTGEVQDKANFHHAGGERIFTSPVYAEDVVLRIRRRG